MPTYPIELGKKMGSDMPMSISEKPKEGKLYYPSLYLEWDESYDLPASGEITLKFKKCSETNRIDSDGKTHQSVQLDITSIEDVEEGPDESDSGSSESRESMMDRYKSESEAKS